jgi:acyl-CoA dehydrogenase
MDWVALMTTLGRDFASRTRQHDDDDSFVGENYAALKTRRAFAAGVPSELGGGGASHAELCAMVRELARHCGSTALAFSMHTHLVATLAYMWRSGNTSPEPMLKRVAAENLVLASSGGSDWLNGSGQLIKVDGGFRMTGRKMFGSGAPGADVLMTTGVYADPESGPTVIHFPLSLKAEGVTVLDTWRTMGMRGTGSHDIDIKDAFLPDAVMQGVRRPVGKWHPFMHTVVLAALPVFYGAYLGVAERARQIAVDLARRTKDNPLTAVLVGELENQIVAAEVTHDSMVRLVTTAKPGEDATVAMLCRRAMLVAALTRAAEKALEVAGGAGFYRPSGLERCFRDLQASRYHPMPEKPQMLITGRYRLGLGLD